MLVVAEMRLFLKLSILAALTLGIHIPAALGDAGAGEKAAEPCMNCHRVNNAHGAPNLEGLPAGYLLRQFELFRSGKRFGPAMQASFNTLSAKDWQDIADYYSSQPAARAKTNVTIDQQAAELGLTVARDLHCAGCHGEDYRGTVDVPRLAGQLRNYLVLQTAKLQRDSSLHPPMSSTGQLIPQPQIEALADYFASLEP